MEKDKKSFLLYSEQSELIEQLTNEEAGELIKGVFRYVNTGETPELNQLSKLVFISIRQDLDRNKEKYEAKLEAQRINGCKGGRPKKVVDEITQENPKNPTVFSKTQKTLYDNDNDNVNDNVNVSLYENVNEDVKEDDNLSLNVNVNEDVKEDVSLYVNDNELSFNKESGELLKDERDLSTDREEISKEERDFSTDRREISNSEKDFLTEKREISKEERDFSDTGNGISSEDRELLEGYIRKKKLATKSVKAYANKLIQNGDYKGIVDAERKKRTKKANAGVPPAEKIRLELESITDKRSCAKVLAPYYMRGDPPEEFDEVMKKYDLDTYDKTEVYLRCGGP